MHDTTATTGSTVPDGAILLHRTSDSDTRYGFVRDDSMLVASKGEGGWEWRVQWHDIDDEEDMPELVSDSFFTTLDACLEDAVARIGEAKRAS